MLSIPALATISLVSLCLAIYISLPFACGFSHSPTSTTANWEGLEDLQSGVFVYRWWVGSELGNDDVIAPTDPHMHLIGGQSAWTNAGLATGLELPDDIYYVSVQVFLSKYSVL